MTPDELMGTLVKRLARGAVALPPAPLKGEGEPYLHPVIRRYKGQTRLSEHQVRDDLDRRDHVSRRVLMA